MSAICSSLGELSPRMREVMVALVEEYIETAQPVSSSRVLERSGLAVSSATVRNSMEELAELQLLGQPHPSAGRVPTDRAFRLYVDGLLETRPREARVSDAFRTALAGAAGLDELLHRAADLLAEETGQLGFFVAAKADRLRVGEIRFIRVSSERVMVILISERGLVQSRVIDERRYDARTLERFGSWLTDFVAGTTLAGARQRLESAIETERRHSDALARRALELGVSGLALLPGAELYLSDLNPLLGQPEFKDLQQLRELIAALEEKERMLQLLDEVMQADVLRVAIGSEIDDPVVDACAVISAPFGDGPALGGLGLIGPIRMRYDRLIPLVRRLSDTINGFIS